MVNPDYFWPSAAKRRMLGPGDALLKQAGYRLVERMDQAINDDGDQICGTLPWL
jgi:hypothetical protein